MDEGLDVDVGRGVSADDSLSVCVGAGVYSSGSTSNAVGIQIVPSAEFKFSGALHSIKIPASGHVMLSPVICNLVFSAISLRLRLNVAQSATPPVP